jgi:hypothetical protein
LSPISGLFKIEENKAMAEEYQFKGPDYNSAVLEMLVQIATRQEALIHLVINSLSDGNDRDKLIREFSGDVEKIRKHMVEKLYEHHGSIDFGEILKL